MTGLLWLATALAVDPAALRQTTEGDVVVDVGTEAVSAAADVGPVLLGASYVPGATVAVHAGWHRALVGAERTWGLDAVVGVGAAALLATPGVALGGVGELRAGARDERWDATLGLVVPVALGLNRPELAVPLGFEARLGVKLGPLWLGGRAQLGPTLSTGGPPAVRAVGAGWVRWDP